MSEQSTNKSREQRENESERGRSWRSLPHFDCNQVAWPHIFTLSRGYFICVPISGHIQFHLRRLAQRSIKPEGKLQKTKRFGSQKSSVKRVSLGLGNSSAAQIPNKNRKQSKLKCKFWWLFKQLTVACEPPEVWQIQRGTHCESVHSLALPTLIEFRLQTGRIPQNDTCQAHCGKLPRFLDATL